jgi:pimeloyl-ACP methyl ester carboxylesterase
VLRAYGDGNLFGEPYGEGPVRVVWLHGWARRGQDFADSARELSDQGISSVALDLPGFGSSPLPTVAGGARIYAQLLTPALVELAQEPLVLVGHSFGGRIATVIAATNPELVRGVVLTGAPLVRQASSAKSPLRYRIVRALYQKGLLSDARMEDARQHFGSADYRNAHGIMRDVLVATVNESIEPELGLVRAPVSMVWGRSDLEVPLEIAQRAAALLSCPHTLRVVEGAGHLLPTEKPHELVTSVMALLG